MANYANLKAQIDANIYQNDQSAITGAIMNTQLKAIVNALGAGYQFMGVATPSTNPGTPDQQVFYLAFDAGVYANFGGTTVSSGQIGVFIFGSVWTYTVKTIVEIVDDLTTGGSGKALSAEQGKNLNASLLGIASRVVTLENDINGEQPTAESVGIPVTAGMLLNNVNNTKTAFSLLPGSYNISYSNPASVPAASVYAFYADGTSENLGGFTTIINPKVIGKTIVAIGLYSSSGVCPNTGTLTLTFTSTVVPTEGLKNDVAALKEDVEEQQESISGLEYVVNGSPESVAYEKTAGTIKYFGTESNIFAQGRFYNIHAVLSVANSVFFGFSKIQSQTFDPENMLQVFNKSVIGTYDAMFVAPDPSIYPYFFVQVAESANTLKISSAETMPLMSNVLRGKKVLMLGDSIMQLPRTGSDILAAGVPEYFAARTGATVIRGAVGGRQIRARRDVNSVSEITDVNWAMATTDICKIVQQLVAGDFALAKAGQTWLKNNAPAAYDAATDVMIEGLEDLDMEDVDIVTIFGGTNDYANNVPLGDTDSDNVILENGALNYMLEALSTAFPQLSVIVFTPIVKKPGGVWCEDPSTINSAGLYLKDYAENNLAAAKRYMFPGCDLYHELGVNQYNFSTYISSDNTHPITFGYKCIAEKMASFVISNVNRE